jgi:hypothetical protein
VGFFWVPVSSNIFDPFAEQLAIAKGFDDTDAARFFALLTLALVDRSIAVFEAKYTYYQWRPVTAIREADTNTNPDTTADPTWIQLLPTTPPFPDPSDHWLQAGAAAEVFRKYLDDKDVIALHSATGLTRASYRALPNPPLLLPPGSQEMLGILLQLRQSLARRVINGPVCDLRNTGIRRAPIWRAQIHCRGRGKIGPGS